MLEPFPNKDSIVIKEKFALRYKKLLGDRYDDFLKYSLAFNRRAIRINTLKVDAQKVIESMKQWTLTPVPWSKDSYWISHKHNRRDIGNTIEHALGYIYVQDPASSIPPVVLDAQPGDKVLDMCAAPGSKTTQIAQGMKNRGVLVANEYVGTRIAALGINLQRMGVTNYIISHSDGNRLDKNLQFDRILVDAPCSGTGTVRKSPKTLRIWNPLMIQRLARTQLHLLSNAYKHLKPGGVIVYSTCTLEPQEDEGVISQFLQAHPDMDVCDIELDINRSEPVTQFEEEEYDPRVKKALRIYPQDNDTEGFFVCKMIRRNSSA